MQGFAGMISSRIAREKVDQFLLVSCVFSSYMRVESIGLLTFAGCDSRREFQTFFLSTNVSLIAVSCEFVLSREI